MCNILKVSENSSSTGIRLIKFRVPVEFPLRAIKKIDSRREFVYEILILKPVKWKQKLYFFHIVVLKAHFF